MDQLYRAQLLQDRKQRHQRMDKSSTKSSISENSIDYLAPLIADGDTGIG